MNTQIGKMQDKMGESTLELRLAEPCLTVAPLPYQRGCDFDMEDGRHDALDCRLTALMDETRGVPGSAGKLHSDSNAD